MTREEAEALSEFINRCSARYQAEPLANLTAARQQDEDNGSWMVLIIDRDTGRAPLPIHDVVAYMERARTSDDQTQMDEDCRKTLQDGIDKHDHDASTLPALNKKMQRQQSG